MSTNVKVRWPLQAVPGILVIVCSRQPKTQTKIPLDLHNQEDDNFTYKVYVQSLEPLYMNFTYKVYVQRFTWLGPHYKLT